MSWFVGYGEGWADIEHTRFGYWVSAGYGPGKYEKTWFRFTHKAARRKAQRVIRQANEEHLRYMRRERLGHRRDPKVTDLDVPIGQDYDG